MMKQNAKINFVLSKKITVTNRFIIISHFKKEFLKFDFLLFDPGERFVLGSTPFGPVHFRPNFDKQNFKLF